MERRTRLAALENTARSLIGASVLTPSTRSGYPEGISSVVPIGQPFVAISGVSRGTSASWGTLSSGGRQQKLTRAALLFTVGEVVANVAADFIPDPLLQNVAKAAGHALALGGVLKESSRS